MENVAYNLMRRTRNLLFFLPLIVAAHGTLAGMLNDSSIAWGVATNGIQMGMSLAQSSDDPEFEVAFRNVGEKDTFLNLGITLANGHRNSPDAVSLVLLDPEGQSRELHLGRITFVAGRMDDYAVGLEVHSIHILRVRLSEFIDPSTHAYLKTLPRGHYEITARFVGRGAEHKNSGMDWTAWNFWEGRVESASVAFDVRESK